MHEDEDMKPMGTGMRHRIESLLAIVSLLVIGLFPAGCADDGDPCGPNESLDESGDCVCDSGTARNGEGLCVALSSCEEIVEVVQGEDPLRQSSGGYRTSGDIVLRNVSDATMTVVGATFSTEFINGGEIRLEAQQGVTEWPPGGEIAYTLSFTPESEDGCAQRAKGEATFGFVNPEFTGCEFFSLPFVYFGECEASLVCAPTAIVFGERIAGFPAVETVTCSNVSDGPLDVLGAEIGGRDADVFAVTADADWPVSLAMGASLDLKIALDYEDIGDFEAELAVEPEGDDPVSISLSGSLVRRRPRCSDPRPDFGRPPLEGGDYSISLETEVMSTYTGQVRSLYRYTDMPPLVGDFLVTSGAFSDPACSVGQNGHRYYWQGEACVADDGAIHNIHAVPAHEKAAEWLSEVETDEELTVIGWEVLRITYDDGGWWQDDGCNTLIVAWVCED